MKFKPLRLTEALKRISGIHVNTIMIISIVVIIVSSISISSSSSSSSSSTRAFKR